MGNLRYNLSELNQVISREIGIYYPEEKLDELEIQLNKVAKSFSFNEKESFISWLTTTPLNSEHIKQMASFFTVGETYFFRHKELYNLLEYQVIPEIISSREVNNKHLKIWSAGCSTGEEVYSIAIVLYKLLDLNIWNMTLMGTDININSLKKGNNGTYTEWSFRDVPQNYKKLYFQTNSRGEYEVLPYLKEMVSFSYLNLVKDYFPSMMNNTQEVDIIICCNVLMYHESSVRREIIRKFYNSLSDGGWLFVSPSETFMINNTEFDRVSFPNITGFKKCVKKSPEIEVHRVKQVNNTEKRSVEASDSYRDSGDLSVQTEAAKKLFQQGLYDDSAGLLTNILNRDNNNFEAIYLMAKIQANRGKLSEAIKLCERGMDINKLEPGIYYLYASILQEMESYKKAIDMLHKVIYLDNTYIIAHFSLGIIYHQQHNSKESKKYFKNTFKLLEECNANDILPDTEGVTAGRLTEIIEGINSMEQLYE